MPCHFSSALFRPATLGTVLAINAFLSASVAWSQSEPEEEAEVVVRGEPGALEDKSAPVQVLSASDLRGQASGRMEVALSNAGVSQFRRADSRSAHPTSQGASLRGLGGNAASRMLVLLDGVPQADPFFGWLAWPGYDALPWATAKVVRGGGSGLLGPGALAGTLLLDTHAPKEGIDFSGDVLGGSRRSFVSRTRGSFPTGPVRSSVGVSFERSDGFVPVPEEQRGSADAPAGYDQFGAAARSEVELPQKVALRATGRVFDDQRNRGYPSSDNHQRGMDVSLQAAPSQLERSRLDRPAWSALIYAQQREFSSSFARVSDGRNEASQVLDQYSVPSMGLGGRLAFAPDLGPDLSLELGGDFRRVLGQSQERYLFVDGAPERERRSGGTNDDVGLFVGSSWQLSKAVVLSASTRVDAWWMHGGFLRERELEGESLTNTRFESRSGVENTSRLGVAVELLSGITVKSASYTGFRLPTLNELYRPYRIGADATAANAALEPERLWGTEVGLWVTRARGLDLSLTVFENRLHNAVSNVTLGRGPGNFEGVGFVSEGGRFAQRRNIDALRSVGVEALASIDAEQLFDVPGAHLDLRYAWIDASVRSSGPAQALAGNAPAQVPRHNLSTTLGFQREVGKSGAFLTLRYLGEQYEDDRNQIILSDAWTLDATANVRLAERVLVTLRAENLTDARVESSRDGTGLVEIASPRTFWVGLSYALATSEPTVHSASTGRASATDPNR